MISMQEKVINLLEGTTDPYTNVIKEDQPLATGPHGRVYKCRSRQDGTFQFAVKQIDIPSAEPSHTRVITSVDSEEKVVKDLIRLKDHNNIVKIFHDIRTEARFLIFMEYLPGDNLSSYIYDKNTLAEKNNIRYTLVHGVSNEEVVLKCLAQIIAGVVFLHRNKIGHYDMKSSNILLGDTRYPRYLKICDYGMSKNFSSKSETSSTEGYRGTVGYRAPEVVASQLNDFMEKEDRTRFGRKSDIWSVGVIGLELATGNMKGLKLEEHAKKVEHDNTMQRFLRSMLVEDPGKRCDADAALNHIKSELPRVTCKINFPLTDAAKTWETETRLIEYFAHHHYDDDDIDDAVDILRAVTHSKWIVVCCSTKSNIMTTIRNIKITRGKDRQYFFNWLFQPAQWEGASEESVQSFLDSIGWTSLTPQDIRNRLNEAFDGWWNCVVEFGEDDTVVHGTDVIIKRSFNNQYITVFKRRNCRPNDGN